jgi:tetratricopeptide (TPR) repeat protein
MAAARGKNKDALKHYQAAARMADERAQPHLSMGAVLLRMGKKKDALAAYQRAAQRSPDDPEVLAGLAQALYFAGRREEAESLEQRISEIDRTAQAQAGRSQAGDLGRSEMLHLAGHRAWLDSRSEAAIDAWLDEARSHAEKGHLDAALDACQQALTVSSGATRVHLELARLYFQRGWNDLAVERLLLLDRLLEMAPEPQIVAAVGRLAADHAAGDPRLVHIARSLGLSSPGAADSATPPAD